MLLSLARIDGHDFVGETCLLKKQGDFRGVRGRVVIEADHVNSFRLPGILAIEPMGDEFG